MSLKKINFLSALFEQNKVSNIYKSLEYAFNEALVYESNSHNELILQQQSPVEINIAFPQYLKPNFNYFNNQYSLKKITQRFQNCYGIILPVQLQSPVEYLKSKFSTNSRVRILKKMKRLEASYNITYKVYFGHIEKNNYDNLITITHEMLSRRFEQRNDTNYVLNSWEKYKELLFHLINTKKASLFVIYNNDKPIQVSVNFHYQKTLFFYILAHNIDYSQFGLGNIAVYKGVEWCIENKYQYLDMGNGELEYKKRWCNYNYQLETHIYYNKNSMKAYTIANCELLIIKVKNVLKTVINSTLYSKLKTSILTIKKSKKPTDITEYTSEKITDLKHYNNNLKGIDNEIDTHFKHINKPICDFIYATREHVNNISVFKILNEKNSFIIKGLDSILKIHCN